ncbi:MAG TPA: MBL fold metallo-hydrolase [Gemmataceae bacterium]|nr:MBL fold metallo-hydrolase [Gemmataceae bacterium]
MPGVRAFTELRLVNGSAGDPALFLDFAGPDDAFLFDAGDLGALDVGRLAGLEAVLLTHFHMDHFVGFDRVLRANLDRAKTLRIVGPGGTIRRVYDRIRSYDIPFFPFQQLALRVEEILPGRRRSALLECARRFPPPDVTEAAWEGPTVYEDAGLRVEAAFTDHTVPGLAYAVADAAGGRLAFVTDTAWSEAARPGLLRLAQGAFRLYCDSYYAEADGGRADLHRHMTATRAAEFARLAGVGELVLMHFAPRYAGRYGELVAEAAAGFPRVSADLSCGAPAWGVRPP